MSEMKAIVLVAFPLPSLPDPACGSGSLLEESLFLDSKAKAIAVRSRFFVRSSPMR
ncbi:hypothetical protein [Nostoc sp.]|uniref:hypothetical protein n=1 Tax=Nostoc sp. TaxID=1180 RepID=UPI00359445C2